MFHNDNNRKLVHSSKNINKLIHNLLIHNLFPKQGKINLIDLSFNPKKSMYLDSRYQEHTLIQKNNKITIQTSNKKNISSFYFFHYLFIDLNKDKNKKIFDKLFIGNLFFGLIRIKAPLNYHVQLKNYLLPKGFKLYLVKNDNIIFIPTIEKSPYFYGQIIENKYRIMDLLKSDSTGRKSDIFLIKNKENKNFILKKYNKTNKYEREKSALLLTYKWKYSPTLLEYDDVNQILIIEWCGIDLRKLNRTDKSYKQRINDIVQDLYLEYELYHNDIRWKNVCINNQNNLTLIDWENASENDRDKNDDGILVNLNSPKSK